MSTSPVITARDIYTPTCTQLLEIQEKVAQKVREEAKKSQDVTLSFREASEKAEALVKQGFEQFESEVKQLFQSPPWSDIADMFLKTSRNRFFYSSLELLGEVEIIIIDKPVVEPNQNNDWEWQ